MKRFLLLMLLCLYCASAFAQRYSISGNVYEDGTKTPVVWAVIILVEPNLWAVADEQGYFKIDNIQKGEYTLRISYLGYVDYETKFNVARDVTGMSINLKPDNLTLNEVTVTAERSTNSMSTTRKIQKTAIDHLQMVNVSDIASLLPGGVTRNPNLMNDNAFSLREGPLSTGLSSFGTAVEVDGVRLSTNANFSNPLSTSTAVATGASTRNISTTNVESVEIITGIPSVEHGDMTGGMIKIKTQRGRTPYRVTMSSNPYNKQVSASKGFGVGNSVLNISLEHTEAINNPTSPYKRYDRNSISLNYYTTFMQKSQTPLQFDLGVTANIGGQNDKDDPDAYSGYYEKKSDNTIRLSTGLQWLLNKPWITNLELKGTFLYEDNLYELNSPVTTSTEGVAVNVPVEGYYLANSLPTKYQALSYNDSKPLEYTAELKGDWNRAFGKILNKVKIGAAWKSSGNMGEGAYYKDPALQKNGYRPRAYSDIPFMNNLAMYLEDKITVPFNETSLEIQAGVRAEMTYIKGSQYDGKQSLSPRFNVKYTVVDKRRSGGLKHLSFRAGWGITEKLPSFNILYPEPNYTDQIVFAHSYTSGKNINVYHTRPYSINYNKDLRWMRDQTTEAAIDMDIWNTRISLTGFYRKTLDSYYLSQVYNPYQFRVSQVPAGYTMPENYGLYVDSQSGEIYIIDNNNPGAGATVMNTRFIDSTFVRSQMPANNAPVHRTGLELSVDFPQIKPIRTSIRLDGGYTYAKYINSGLSHYLPTSGHTSGDGRSFQYVAIFPNTYSSSSTYNGQWSDEWRANLTFTTHIPSARIIVSLRIEGMLYSRSQNLSEVNGKTLAYAIDENGKPTGADIYAGNSTTALRPYYYMDARGNIYQFTDESAANPELSRLIRTTNTEFSYNQGGYNSYFLGNLSITKEIGNIASISFYANNFTNMRKTVADRATKVNEIRGGRLYYGLSLRLTF